MTLFYIANARLPTEKAHGIQIAKMCEAFADAGAEVRLIAPRRRNPIAADIFSYYGINRNFEVTFLPVYDAVGLGRVGFWLTSFLFSCAVLRAGIPPSSGDFVIFTRDVLCAYTLARRGYKVFFEIHYFPGSFLYLWGRMLKNFTGIISQNNWKKEQLMARFGIPAEKILVAPNGFDPKLFEIKESRDELREKLGLPLDKKIILYTGHLYDWKGAGVLLDAAHKSRSDIFFVFVGGTEGDISRFRRDAEGLANVLIIGHRPHKEIPRWLKAADVLVLPNSAVSEESRFSTSPIKLFEYMASGIPIAAADLPSIREIVTGREVYLFAPDSPVALADAIRQAFCDPTGAGMRASAALDGSGRYTWDARARAIFNFMCYN